MNKKIGIVSFVTFGTILFFVSSATVTNASTIYVPDNHITIQEAVYASNDGDMIIVRDGTYSENINVNKSLTIRSENGSTSTKIMAANPKTNVFTVTADYVNINGLTITGTTSDKLTDFAAGIYLSQVNYGNISYNNISYNGDGIWLWNSNNNIIIDNIANSNDNYGIYLFSISDNNIIICNIVNFNNVSGIELWGSNNNMIANNIASGNDRGVYLWDSSENTLSGNNADSNKNYGFYLLMGGTNILQSNANSNNNYGIYLDKSRNNRLQNNTLSNNNYGIYMFSSESIIDQNNFIDNKENIYTGTSRPPVFEIVFSITGLLAMWFMVFIYKRHFSRFGYFSKKAIGGVQVFIILFNILFYLWLVSEDLWSISKDFNMISFIAMKIIGILVFALGAFFIFWSMYYQIKGIFIRENKQIVKGPYAIVRHPLYLGWIIGAIGLASFNNSLIGLIYSFMLSLILFRIADYEEEDSRTRIGDEYVEYIKKVPKLFPFGK